MKSENSNRIVPIDNELNLLLKQFKNFVHKKILLPMIHTYSLVNILTK